MFLSSYGRDRDYSHTNAPTHLTVHIENHADVKLHVCTVCCCSHFYDSEYFSLDYLSLFLNSFKISTIILILSIKKMILSKLRTAALRGMTIPRMFSSRYKRTLEKHPILVQAVQVNKISIKNSTLFFLKKISIL